MAEIINIKTAVRLDLSKHIYKVTLTSLALAMEYYTKVVPDPALVKEAGLCLLRHDEDLVCMVTHEMYVKVVKEMPAGKAVKKLLLAKG